MGIFRFWGEKIIPVEYGRIKKNPCARRMGNSRDQLCIVKFTNRGGPVHDKGYFTFR
jgi:hypothetical protein